MQQPLWVLSPDPCLVYTSFLTMQNINFFFFFFHCALLLTACNDEQKFKSPKQLFVCLSPCQQACLRTLKKKRVTSRSNSNKGSSSEKSWERRDKIMMEIRGPYMTLLVVSDRLQCAKRQPADKLK